jgi:hypothetical protein
MMWSLFLLLLSYQQHTCNSQEAPMTGATKFDNSTSYRTNVCNRQRSMLGQSIELRDALKGFNLSVYLTDHRGRPDWYHSELTLDEKLPERNPGVAVLMLDEIARRAGFSWRNSYGAGKALNVNDGNKTWTDLLKWSVDFYDISAGPWYASNERRALGISFPFPYVEDKSFLVSKKKRKLEFQSFLAPFDWKVWIMIAASIIVTAILYNFLETMTELSDQRRPGIITAAFLSAVMFTGHFEFRVSADIVTSILRILVCLNRRSSASNIVG